MIRPRNRRIAFVAALATALTFTAAATDAFARAGKSSSSSIGSRGERTQSAPAPTPTAPNTVSPSQAAPTRPAQQPGMAQPAAQSGGFFSRGGFGGMLMGGLIGAGIAGMLFGGGFLDGLGSLAGMLGFLLQVALIGFLVMLAVRFFKNRRAAQQGPQPAYAGSGLGQGMGGQGMGGPLNREQAPGNMGGGLGGGGLGGLMGGLGGAQPAPAPTHTAPERSDEIGVVGSDYEAFERILVDVQDAYSRGDRAALARLATAEVAGHFTAELDDAAARGVVNSVSAVKLEQGDLSEAWREADAEYATVAIRFSMVDVTMEKATGKVVDGDPAARVEATEIWTFRRAAGGAWILSAIQQA